MIRAYLHLVFGLLLLLAPLVAPYSTHPAAASASDDSATPPADPSGVGWRVSFAHRATWGERGAGPGQFDGLAGLALDPQTGGLYCADAHNDRVQVLDANGAYCGSWGTPGSATGQLQSPVSLAVSKQGWIYVADEGNDRIQAFTPTGQAILAWPVPRPSEIQIGPSGEIYVLCQQGLGQVQVFSPAGAALGQLVLADGQGRYVAPSDILVHSGGRLYAADPLRRRLVAFSLRGDYQFEWPYLDGAVSGLGMSAADGLLYVSTDASGTQMLTPLGIELATLPVNDAAAVVSTGGNPATLYFAVDGRIEVYEQRVEQLGFSCFVPYLSNAPNPTPTKTPHRTETPTPTETEGNAQGTPTPTSWADTYEPNDSFDEAWGPLVPGQTYRSYIWSRNDDDYYYFYAMDASPITVELIDPPPDTDYDLYLYDAAGRLLDKSEQLGSIESVTYEPGYSGLFYVLVCAYDHRTSRRDAYGLVTQFAQFPPTATPSNPYPWPPTPTPRQHTSTPTPLPPKGTPTRVRPTRTPTATPWASITPTPRR